MIDFGKTVLDTLYNGPLAVPADVTFGATGVVVRMRAMDKTSGIIAQSGRLAVETMKPACRLRSREITSNGYVPADLMNGSVTLWPGTDDEVTWDIESFDIMPSPSGNLAGEVTVILINNHP